MFNIEIFLIINIKQIAPWKLIGSLVSGDAGKKIQVVKKGDLTKYVPKDQLWGHLAEKN